MKNYETRHSGNERSKRKKRKWDDGDLMQEQRKRMEALEEEYINQVLIMALDGTLCVHKHSPQTQLRALRTKQLEALNEEGYAPRVPDGVAICDGPSTNQTILLLEGALNNIAQSTEPKKVLNPISCYICHKPYLELHFFYHQLCPDCAAFNFSKRNEMADLRGKVCIVTGARCKIGYRCALKLLRCGASVIATTRFPADAAKRYALEADSDEWSDRLHIYGLDFRDIALLERFCAFVMNSYERLDVIINNACQTVRRPPAYYAHLIGAEKEYQMRLEAGVPEPTEPSSRVAKTDAMLRQQHAFAAGIGLGHGTLPAIANITDTRNSSMPHPPSTGDLIRLPEETTSIGHYLSSSDMTQIHVAPEDGEVDPEAFPTGILDVNRQQIDLRKKNSWTMKLHEVSTPELAEVFVINAMAPAIIDARLKPLMEKNMKDLKFIVNVSAMEGKFYRYKSDSHPHTNMAKAALNMMTRTSAQDYVKSNIFMTAVDTGWINDEKPAELAVAHEKKHKFQTPLDEIDAASRVLDPVIGPIKAIQCGEIVEPPWGLFLKDYMKCEW